MNNEPLPDMIIEDLPEVEVEEPQDEVLTPDTPPEPDLPSDEQEKDRD
jgi:hypothetical protein